MTDGRRMPNQSPPASQSRREFLEQGAKYGLALGAGALAASGLWLPSTLDAAELEPLGTAGPLQARATQRAQTLTLANAAIEAQWTLAGDRFRFVRLREPNGGVLEVPVDAFTVILADGEPLRSSELRVVGPARVEQISGRGGASRLAARLPGRRIVIDLADFAKRVAIQWRAELRDGSRYIRQEIAVHPLSRDINIREVLLIDLPAANAIVNGTVKGSPLIVGRWFAAVEHPLAVSLVDGRRARSSLTRQLPLRMGTSLELSSVIGTTRPGQLRRDFLAYVERERAHPYRPYLHYNSWYDLGYFSKFNEAEALAVISAFGEQLQRRRGVELDSFLFDDGWDDPKTLWGFHSGFPRGFSAIREAAARYGTSPGVWMSPWGGYGRPKQDRLANGRSKGFETNAGGFALSGPVYYKRFLETCLTMIRRYGVNQFKFDGTGNADRAFRGSAFGSDFEAAIALIETLRNEKPDLYVNLTTGTYPSPFWLRWADSVWRGGEDHEFLGLGTKRQQWITYRDADTFANVVRRGPLFPINSLMLHGLIFARSAKDLDTDPHNDFESEIRSYFGSGTQLQEMYVTPRLLTQANWDALAESAKWSRRNASTLVDTHWIGGDPALLQPYGWASWSPRGGIITMRNPSDKVQAMAVDVAEAFELPEGTARAWSARNPFASPRERMIPTRFIATQATRVDLQPFEVLTLEITPSAA